MNIVVVTLILAAGFYLIFMMITMCFKKDEEDSSLGLPKNPNEALSDSYTYEYKTNSSYIMPNSNSDRDVKYNQTIRSNSSMEGYNQNFS